MTAHDSICTDDHGGHTGATDAMQAVQACLRQARFRRRSSNGELWTFSDGSGRLTAFVLNPGKRTLRTLTLQPIGYDTAMTEDYVR